MKKHHIVFILFFILVLIEHCFLYLHFDDYAYGSLSYSYILEGIEGTNYNIIDIIKFCAGHYISWGGRVLCYFIEAILLKLGLPVLRLVQSLIITSIFYLIYKIITKKDDYKLAIFTVSMYFIIDIMIVSSGIMWIAASTSYIFPLLPFLLYIYLDKKKDKNIPILIFLAAFSQEQIGAAAICYTFVDYALKWHETKKINNTKLKPLIISSIGFIILMLAPGNFKRIEEASFYDLSLIDKIKIQSHNIIENIFYNRNTYFIKLIIITSIILNNKNKIIKALNVVYLIFDLILLNGYYDTLVNNNMYIVFIIHLIAIIITNIKKEYLIYILPAIASQIIMMLAPYYPSRSIIPFMFLYFIIIIDVIRKNKYFKYIMIFVLIIGLSNYGYITYGYYQNKESNKYNHELLLEISKKNKEGANIMEAKLKKAKNNMFANTLPYEDPNTIYPYMRQYYNLDENFVFIYE